MIVISQLLKILKSMIFPEWCLLCGKEGQLICQKCTNNLSKPDFTTCIACDNLTINGETHKYCSSSNQISNFYYLYEYSEPLKRILKHAKDINCAFKYFKYLIKHNNNNSYENLNQSIDLITYIPRSTIKNRLIDHAQYIALQIISIQKLSTTKLQPLLKISKHTKKPQKELNREERFLASKGKYNIDIKNYTLIKDKTILIIDDIATTGASIGAAADCLLNAGAAKVIAITLAKEIRYN